MADAGRLTDEELRKLAYDPRGVSMIAKMAQEIIERRAQSEGQAKVAEEQVDHIAQIIDCDVPALTSSNFSDLTIDKWKEHRREHFRRLARNVLAALTPPRQTEETR